MRCQTLVVRHDECCNSETYDHNYPKVPIEQLAANYSGEILGFQD